jgi:hypothetical protein
MEEDDATCSAFINKNLKSTTSPVLWIFVVIYRVTVVLEKEVGEIVERCL